MESDILLYYSRHILQLMSPFHTGFLRFNDGLYWIVIVMIIYLSVVHLHIEILNPTNIESPYFLKRASFEPSDS